VETMKPRNQSLSFSLALLALATASVNAFALPKIRLLATGGTIASAHSKEGKR
jgi:L-asparaginase/Glu-tRNA(Gln) amidotransferase subunit D